MSFQKSVLLFREDPPADVSGKGFYDNVDDDNDSPADPPPTVPPVDPPPAVPPVVPPVTPPVEPPPTVPPVVPPVDPQPTTPPPALPVDWRKEIKTADHKEVLKELGYDDFAIGMLEYGKRTGDYVPYVEAKTVDYTGMTPEQLIRLEMKNDPLNKGMSEKALDFKFNKFFKEKYFTDREVYPDASDEAEFGKEQLRLDGERLKSQFIEKQQSFKAPEPKPDTAAADLAAQSQQRRDLVGNLVLNNEVTTALKTAKSITIGEGEDSFLFAIPNVDQLVTNMQSLIANGERADLNGVDLKYLYTNMAIGMDSKNFLDLYGKHMRSLEHKKIQDELQNITPPVDGSVTPPVAPVTGKGFYDR